MINAFQHHLVRSRRFDKADAGTLEQVLGDLRLTTNSTSSNSQTSSTGPTAGVVVLHFTGDELPPEVVEQNNLHTSCDHQFISTLFVQTPTGNHTYTNGGPPQTVATIPPAQA